MNAETDTFRSEYKTVISEPAIRGALPATAYWPCECSHPEKLHWAKGCKACMRCNGYEEAK